MPAKNAKTNSADLDQTASEEAVLSGSSLFATMTITSFNYQLYQINPGPVTNHYTVNVKKI